MSDVTLKQIINKTMELDRVFANEYDVRDQYMDLVEEVGELSQAMQISMRRKHTNNPSKQRTREDVIDAICDVMFQVIRLAEKLEINLEEEYPKMIEHIKERAEKGEFIKNE